MNASTEDDYINYEICKLLIENGANVNDKDLQGDNVLIYASTFLKWDLAIIKLLIESGVEIKQGGRHVSTIKRGYDFWKGDEKI